MKAVHEDCPRIKKMDCPLCGKWLGWIDLSNPGRSPSIEEWAKVVIELQDEHDQARQRKFDSLRIL